ncbi:hypothetical protein GCM10027059_19550 [Myceligenerans halotolerans]
MESGQPDTLAVQWAQYWRAALCWPSAEGLDPNLVARTRRAALQLLQGDDLERALLLREPGLPTDRVIDVTGTPPMVRSAKAQERRA